MPKIESLQAFDRYRKAIESERNKYQACVSVCGGTGCHAHGCGDVYAAFESEVKGRGLADTIELKMTGCHGFCELGPLVVIWPHDIFYKQVKPEDVPQIVEKTLLGAGVVEELLYQFPGNGKRVAKQEDIPFYNLQRRILMQDNGRINPRNIDDYVTQGGYTALAGALFEMEPEEIIDKVEKAGLRGRGGAGFPTARKWRSCRKAKSRDGIKYVLCNADEGDPGAYMDRSLLEGNPHAVLEGMSIGAYAIGANQGIIYVRHEYPLALENLFVALEQARELGFLGVNILDSGFDFDIKVSVGGGAFICGESTALISSIEGHIGEPRVKHVHTAERGLYNRPTNLNNVETWANVPLILKNGADDFAAIGTDTSKGTKIFSLVGKINNTGLVEVPMGTTLREIIYDIGGGMPNGKAFKAVQTGGPSGGCIPESLLDTPVDFDRLYDVGSMMGSGGMIVMDEDTCMVDIARYFLTFLCDESCGKCVPCREGLKQMLYIIEDISEGRGSLQQLELLKELAEVVRDTSLCGLGQTAPNPVLSTIRYFEDEYRAHILEHKCPAGACRELITFEIDPEACTGCMKCLKSCPVGAVTGEKKEPHSIDQSRCEKCGICLEVCKYDAVIRK